MGPLDYVLISQELRYWGNFLVALGWVALTMLLCQRGWRLGPVAAVGRMALTNYLSIRSRRGMPTTKSTTTTKMVPSVKDAGFKENKDLSHLIGYAPAGA